MVSPTRKILLIRFSSFGDVTQSLSIPSRLKEWGQESGETNEVHWFVREDLATLLKNHPGIDRIWTLNRGQGLRGLFHVIGKLKNENFTHIYDAHNNLRSHIVGWFLRPPLALSRLLSPPHFLRKSQKRWKRFLLFRFRKNLYEQPFSGQRDLLEPLTRWGLKKTLPAPPQIFFAEEDQKKAHQLLGEWARKKYVCLAASAAYELKRWPLENWKKFVEMEKDLNFVLLGGSEDHFLDEIRAVAPDRVLNLAGKTNFSEVAAVVAGAQALIANDTGPLHVGEQLGLPTIALMGPAPFGFPSRPSTRILERKLSCRPCSKHGQGPCINEIYQLCLRDISPGEVRNHLEEILRRA